MAERRIFSNIWIRYDTTNLINFTKFTGTGHAVYGSEIHCYKHPTITTNTYFYADISGLTDGKTYYFWITRQYGTQPSQIAIVNSSDSAVKSLSTTNGSKQSFVKTSTMNRIRIRVVPTLASATTVMLTDDSSSSSYVPYIQRVEAVAQGSNYVEVVKRGRYLVNNYIGSVIRYKTESNSSASLNKNSFYYDTVVENLLSEYSGYYLLRFDSVAYVLPNIFSSSSNVNWLVIPKEYGGFENFTILGLAKTGKVYIHKDAQFLTYSDGMKNFDGWEIYLYDTDYDDVVGYTDQRISYGYGS